MEYIIDWQTHPETEQHYARSIEESFTNVEHFEMKKKWLVANLIPFFVIHWR